MGHSQLDFTASHIYSHINTTLTVANKQGHIMLKLLTLLIAGAAAAPQYAPYGYPLAYQPAYQYGYYPQYRYLPVHYPIYPGAVTPDVTAQTRGLFGLEIAGFQSNSANFVTSGSTQVMQGNVKFEQNIFTGSSSAYNIWLQQPSDNSITLAGNKYNIYVSTAAAGCTYASGTATLLASVTAPSVLVNGFYAKGTSSTFNLDGTDSKTDITGRYIIVLKDGSTSVIGCTGALS